MSASPPAPPPSSSPSLALFVALDGGYPPPRTPRAARSERSGATIKDRSIKASRSPRARSPRPRSRTATIGAADLDAPLTAKLAAVGRDRARRAQPARPVRAGSRRARPSVPADGVDACQGQGLQPRRAWTDVGTRGDDDQQHLPFGTIPADSCKSCDLDVDLGAAADVRPGPLRRRARGHAPRFAAAQPAVGFRPGRADRQHGRGHALQPRGEPARRRLAVLPPRRLRRQRLNAGIRGASHSTGAATIAVAPMRERGDADRVQRVAAEQREAGAEERRTAGR